MNAIQPIVPKSAFAMRVDRLIVWFFRHWLALFLTPLLFFVTLPFLAPALMAVGWEQAGVRLYTLYMPFCHQLPQRSWFFFGEKLTYTLAEIQQVYPYTDVWRIRFFYGTPDMGWRVAWSDRMVSFYFMTPVFGLFYAFLRQAKRHIHPIPFWLLLATLMPLAVDGTTHLLSDGIFGISSGGFRDTNVWLAWLTANAWPDFYAGDHFGTFNWWARLLTGIIAAWGMAFYTFPWVDRFIAGELDHMQVDTYRITSNPSTSGTQTSTI